MLQSAAVAQSVRRLATLAKTMATPLVKVGDMLPDVTLAEGVADFGTPKPVSVRQLFAGKKAILFGIPGAFTLGCSKTHLPSYVKDYDMLKGKGVDLIVCTATNDPYVMQAWGAQNGCEGKVVMLADPEAKFCGALGLTILAKSPGAITRSQRYSAIVVDNKITHLNLESDGGMACTLSNSIYTQLITPW